MAISLILESGYFVADGSKDLIGRRMRESAAQPNIRKILDLPRRGYEALIQVALNESAPKERSDKVNAVIICTAIGLAGWVAWTAADRIRDGENPARANAGNGADGFNDDLYVFSILRPIIDELIGRLSLPTIYLKRLKRIIGMMEYANSSHCALGTREQSIWKSMGAAVPLLALMMKVGAQGTKASEIDALNKNIVLCEDFFRNFILARQLSDDALDWKEDAGVGNGGRLKTAGANGDTLVVRWMERAFDRQVKYEVAAEMLKRSRRAVEKARNMSCFTDTVFLEELPRNYEEMAEKILRKPER